LIKLLRLYGRLRYWRSRALRAETRLIELSAQAEAERWRNVSREDTFVSAAVLGGRGMVGIPPRSGPAETGQPSRFVTAADPWQALTRIEHDEFEKEWLVDAVTHNVSPQQARNDFLAELAKRKSFNDEPSM